MESMGGHICFSQKRGFIKYYTVMEGSHLFLVVVSHFAAVYNRSLTEGLGHFYRHDQGGGHGF